MATQNKIRDLLNTLVSLPNAPEISADVVREYHAVLGHWPDELLDMAVLHYKSSEVFFPTPGTLNNKILDLQFMAMGIPTAAEAWSQVLGAVRQVPTVLCETGSQLRTAAEGRIGGEYMSAIADYSIHFRNCEICTDGGWKEIYDHPVVAETVRLLGGRDMLLTDNLAADRKQFIDAYRERVQIEGRKFIMPPKIRDFIADQRLLEVGDQVKQLAKGMSK